MATWPQGKGPLIGYCTGCGSPVYKEMSDRISKSAHCPKCGLEYGNRQLEPLSWRTRQPVQDDREVLRKLVDNTFNQLIAKRPAGKLPLKAFLAVLDKLSWSADRKHIHVFRISELNQWGYVIEHDTIRRKGDANTSNHPGKRGTTQSTGSHKP